MYSNILVPLDGSEAAEHALPQAEALARSFGSTLHVVQVVLRYPELGTVLAGGLVSPDTSELGLELARRMYEFQKSKGEAYLESLEARLRDAGITVQTALIEGVADERIIEYASEHDVDLIVMSAWGGNSGLRRFLLGSVTDRVLHASKVSVMVVRPKPDST